jgi:hypothetical protein
VGVYCICRCVSLRLTQRLLVRGLQGSLPGETRDNWSHEARDGVPDHVLHQGVAPLQNAKRPENANKIEKERKEGEERRGEEKKKVSISVVSLNDVKGHKRRGL